MRELVHDVTYIALDTRSSTIGSSEPRVSLRTMVVRSLSGTLVSPGRYWKAKHSDEVPSDVGLSEIIDGQGEWSALAATTYEGENHFVYLGDPTGFSPVFYSLIPERAVVVSDSFSGVVQGVRKLGGNLTLNLPNYLTLLSGKTATFQNLIADETMANEIKLLGHDEALYAGSGSVSIISRQKLSDTQDIYDYNLALSRGIETTSATIEKLVLSNTRHNPIITLTGGVDSRLVLALLTTTGLTSKFSVWSMDPRNAKRAQQKKVLTADIEIASELRRKYGLQWMRPRLRSKVSLSFEEALAHYQSFNSNFAFSFTPANHVTVDEQPILTLRGGGGEVLRGTGGARIMAARYTDHGRNNDPISENTWAAKYYLNQSLGTASTLPLAEQYLREILSRYSNSSLRERLDAFYRTTRNRGHFGHLRQSDVLNDRLMQVLANPFLVRAAELCEYEFRTRSGMVLDLFNQIDPSLRSIPFESDAANSQLYSGNPINFKYQNRDGWQKELDRLRTNASPVQYRILANPGDRNENWSFISAESSVDFIRAGFDSILDFVPDTDRLILAPLHELTIESVIKRHVSLGSVVAKVASALDIFSPLPLSLTGTHLYTDPSRCDRIPSSNHLNQAASSYRLR